MTINIEYETEKKLDLDYETIIRQVVEKAMDYEKCPYEAEVNVTRTMLQFMKSTANTAKSTAQRMCYHFR